MEVFLYVNNGLIEVNTSIWIEILNAVTLNIDELGNNQKIKTIHYYDLVGRRLSKSSLNNNQIHIQKVIYDDGVCNFFKKLYRK